MKFIVSVEVEAQTPGQAIAIVDGIIDDSKTYRNIQCWTQAEAKAFAVKAGDLTEV